jgi:hypothetical protein
MSADNKKDFKKNNNAYGLGGEGRIEPLNPKNKPTARDIENKEFLAKKGVEYDKKTEENKKFEKTAEDRANNK